MSTWFETKVRYTKAQEDGSEKPVTEAYVVDALSFTEAESRITDEMAVYVSGEFKVSGISKAAYGEVFFSDMDGDDNGIRPSCRLSPLMTNREGEAYHRQLPGAVQVACPCPALYRRGDG